MNNFISGFCRKINVDVYVYFQEPLPPKCHRDRKREFPPARRRRRSRPVAERDWSRARVGIAHTGLLSTRRGSVNVRIRERSDPNGSFCARGTCVTDRPFNRIGARVFFSPRDK